MHRSTSDHDIAGTNRARKAVQLNYVADDNPPYYKNDCAWTSIVLPDLQLTRAQKRFVYDRLFDTYTQNALEECRALNWCPSVAPMMPLNTLGDGNCLLHATSLFVWGYHDRNLDLRRSIYDALVRDRNAEIRTRWQTWRDRANKNCSDSMKVSYDPRTWREEWIMILNAVDPDREPRQRLQSLEEIHIFVLANVLRRPVIVLSQREIVDVSGEPLQPVTMGGIYLPLLCDSFRCCKTPVVIGFADGHFTPMLFAAADDRMHVVPLVRPGHRDLLELPVQFMHSTRENANDLCEDYLELADVEWAGSRRRSIKAAACFSQPPLHQNLFDGFVRYLIDEERAQTFGSSRPGNGEVPHAPPLRPVSSQRQLPAVAAAASQFIRCVTPGCSHYGSKDRQNMCSECFSKARRRPRNQSLGEDALTKCRTKGCAHYGSKDRGYLCLECSQQGVLLRRAEEEKQRRAAANQRRRPTQLPCQTPGCTFFSDPELGSYCSACFRKMTIVEHERNQEARRMADYRAKSDPVPVPAAATQSRPTPPPPPPPRSPLSSPSKSSSDMRNRCRGPDCEKRGIADNYNFCDDCFAKSIEEYHSARKFSSPAARSSSPLDLCHSSPNRRPRCQNSSCEFFGDERLNGDCSGCLKARERPADLVPPLKKDPAVKMVKTKVSSPKDDLLSISPCRRKGCALFAPKGNSGYCFECQEKRNGVTRQMRCRRDDCTKCGSAEKEGFCDECYLMYACGVAHRRPTDHDGLLESALKTRQIPCMNTTTCN